MQLDIIAQLDHHIKFLVQQVTTQQLVRVHVQLLQQVHKQLLNKAQKVIVLLDFIALLTALALKTKLALLIHSLLLEVILL